MKRIASIALITIGLAAPLPATLATYSVVHASAARAPRVHHHGHRLTPQERCERSGGDWDSMSDIGPACLR